MTPNLNAPAEALYQCIKTCQSSPFMGIGAPGKHANPREVFIIFAAHWHLFLGTPRRVWLDYVLHKTQQITAELSAETTNLIYDQIAERLTQDAFRPRTLFESFNIEILATTDSALDDLFHHAAISASG